MVEGITRIISENYFEFGPVVQEEILFIKYIYILAIAAILFRGANPSVQFNRGHYEEHYVKYFDFGPVVQEEVSFKDTFILSSDCHFAMQSGIICASLVYTHYHHSNLIWRTVSRRVDGVIPSDHPRRVASRVIQWYSLIHET